MKRLFEKETKMRLERAEKAHSETVTIPTPALRELETALNDQADATRVYRQSLISAREEIEYLRSELGLETKNK